MPASAVRAPATDNSGTDRRNRLFLPILAILYVLGFLNLFLRGSFGVMAPDLAREMALSPGMLSTIASAFFFAYAAMQVPTGMLLDRFGPRRTLATMLLFTTAGAAVFAASRSSGMLVLARVLMGIGCAGIFTGAFYVLALWLPQERVVTRIGALNSFAAFGTLCATTPLAALIALIGWRESYVLFTGGVLLVMLAVAVVMRDGPPGSPPPASKDESIGQIFAGVRECCRQPGMLRLLVAGVPLSAGSTIAGVWGAPYLKDIHALGDISRGNVLLAMAVCGMAGHYLFGRVARRLNTLKRMIIGGGSVVAASCTVLAVLSGPPLPLVVGLFCLISLTAAYPTITHAHARGLVPARLMGRGVSLTNMGVMTAIALMQFAFGWIVGAFPAAAGVPPETAFRAGFAVQAIAATLAVLIYWPIPDVKPRG